MGIITCFCCLKKAYSKTLEINWIVFNSIYIAFYLLASLIFLFSSTSIIDFIVLAFLLFLLLLSILNLIFSSIIRYWRAKNLIKTEKRNIGISLSKAGLGFAIILFIICFPAYIIMVISISNISSYEMSFGT